VETPTPPGGRKPGLRSLRRCLGEGERSAGSVTLEFELVPDASLVAPKVDEHDRPFTTFRRG